MEMATEGWQWAVIVLLFVIAWLLTRILADGLALPNKNAAQ